MLTHGVGIKLRLAPQAFGRLNGDLDSFRLFDFLNRWYQRLLCKVQGFVGQ
jgi:hypothetical protein